MKVRKVATLLFCAVPLFLGACGGGNNGSNNGGGPQPGDDYEYVSMLTDKKFEKGFIMRGLGSPIYNDPIETFGTNKYDPNVYFQYEKTGLTKPDWNLCQWATRYPFHDVNNSSPHLPNGKINYAFEALSEGVYKYTNSSKTMTVDTNTGEYSLGLKASECFKYPRTAGQEWPHWFIEKNIYAIPNPPIQCSVAQSYGINVRFDIRLNSFTDHMGAAMNPGLHSAMCVFYLFVANRDPKTSMFTDMLWFGLRPFDSRYTLAPKESFPDVGSKGSATEKWIYNIAGSEILTPEYNLKTADNKPILNEWRSVDVDVLGYIDEALTAAQENGYMANSSWENLYINGMYFGYETPGTFDIDMSYRNLDIVSLLKK